MPLSRSGSAQGGRQGAAALMDAGAMPLFLAGLTSSDQERAVLEDEDRVVT